MAFTQWQSSNIMQCDKNYIVTPNRLPLLYWLGLVGAVLLFTLQIAVPGLPALPLHLENGEWIHLIPFPNWHWPLLLLGCGFGSLALWSARQSQPRRLTPLAGLPFLLLAYAAPHRIPVDLPGNILFLGSLLILTVTLDRILRPASKAEAPDAEVRPTLHNGCRPGLCPRRFMGPKSNGKRVGFCLLVGLTLFYTVTGTYVSSQVGEHYVDEGHYLTQALSLYEDRDLNIRNNFGFDVDEAIQQRMNRIGYDESNEEEVRAHATWEVRRHLHISFRSPDDRWYSWHPYGVSLLLAPTMGGPVWVRQLLLGFLAAIGVWFSFLTCLEMGRSVRWSLAICLLWGFSTYYFVFAVRALPEALGASLFAAALYSCLIARRRPIGSFALLVGSCAFMPIAHPRFLICAGLVGLLYYARVFIGYRPPRRVTIIYILLVFAGAAAVIAYLLINHAAYQSLTAYPPLRQIFGMYPEGRWLLLFSERGLIFGLPASVALLLGGVYGLYKDRPHRGVHILGGGGFLIMLLVMGAVESWDGGPTMYGRYLLIGLPALIPGCVLLTEQTSRLGRRWILFLFVFSAAFTFVSVTLLDLVGVTMLRLPWQAIRQALPLLRGLFFPYHVSDIMVGWPYHGLEAFTVNLFSLLLLVTSLFAVLPMGRDALRRGIPRIALALLLGGSVWLHQRHGRDINTWSPVVVENRLSRTLPAWAALRGTELSRMEVLQYSNRFGGYRPTTLIAADADREQFTHRVYLRDRVDRNDWADRGYRWLTLMPPAHPGLPGPRRVRIRGHVSGDGTAYWAVRQGSHTLIEESIDTDPHTGQFDIEQHIDLPSLRGHLHVLVRLAGDGHITVDALHWTPLIGDAEDSFSLLRLLRELPQWIRPAP